MTPQTEYLRQHAIKNVWCAPSQDSQFIFELPRVSSTGGALRLTTIAGYPLDMPDTFSRWQIFQIGGIPPNALNLLTRSFTWVNAATQANELNTSVRLFSNTGVVASLCDVFYRYTQHQNLVIAVRMHSRTPITWSAATVFLQLYSNAYWKSASGNTNPTGFEAHSALLETTQQITNFNSLYAIASSVATSQDQLSFWHNGFKKNFAATTKTIGDSVFFELDGSIKRRVLFPINGLDTFDSILDTRRKYLLHPVKDDNSTTIDYCDDVEVFIQGSDMAKTTLLYPRIKKEDIRQLTHRDYSVVVSNVAFQSPTLRVAGGGNVNTYNLELVVRNSGYNRSLIHEKTFIQELYKLDEIHIKRALSGIDATVPFWRASALEASSYPAVMRAPDIGDVTYQLIEQAYGYHAMAKALADTPSTVINPGNSGFIGVPFLLMHGCTAYEYDAAGFLLGWYHHYVGDRYFTTNQTCTKVELLSGIGSTTLDETHGVKNLTVQTNCNHRVYLRNQIGGLIQPTFTDVTGSNNYTLTADGLFTWTNTAITDYPTLRSDKRFYACDFETDITDGKIVVSMVSNQKHGNITLSQPLVIPLGQMDVMFNGRSLIRGLQYFVKGNQVIITAREYVDQLPNVKQKVHVRFYGFCRADGSLYPEGDVGFIEHGLLSNNNRFDVRDGRVTRVIVDGSLKSMSELTFSEESNQVSPLNVANGQPYMVKDIFVPLKPFSEPDTWVMIEEARSMTKVVSDYITLMSPEQDRGNIQAVVNKHQLVSPFLAKILYDLIYGRLGLPSKTTFTRQDIISLCKVYEPLLLTDPISQDLNVAYVVIQPHVKTSPVGVTPKQWQFLSQVVQLYAPGKVDLNSSLSIST